MLAQTLNNKFCFKKTLVCPNFRLSFISLCITYGAHKHLSLVCPDLRLSFISLCITIHMVPISIYLWFALISDLTSSHFVSHMVPIGICVVCDFQFCVLYLFVVTNFLSFGSSCGVIIVVEHVKETLR